MPLYSIPENELREHCKRAVEALELWLRRFIDDKLSSAFGANYVDATRTDGTRVLRAELSRSLKGRASKEPQRFPRPIDAALLDDLISIVCNPILYEAYFAEGLAGAFPSGPDTLRIFLERLITPRNALYHANPLSVHDAHRILCYTMDVVASLKSYYARVNVAQQFNVPTVIRVSDSLGQVSYLSGPTRTATGFTMLDYSRDEGTFLRCGDTLSIEVDVDPTFDSKEFEIEWVVANISAPMVSGRKFVLVLTERYVATRFCVSCRVISNKSWHKLGTHDDQIDIAYRILPPLL